MEAPFLTIIANQNVCRVLSNQTKRFNLLQHPDSHSDQPDESGKPHKRQEENSSLSTPPSYLLFPSSEFNVIKSEGHFVNRKMKKWYSSFI